MATNPPSPNQAPPSFLQKLVQSPRASFIENPDNVRKHRELLQQPELKAAMDVALAEMSKAVISLSRNTDMLKPGLSQAAEASFHIIHGAHEFVEVFYRLVESLPPLPPRRPNDSNLEQLD